MEKKQKSSFTGRIRMQFDLNYPGTTGISGDGISNTVPDMSITVRQMLENHTRGLDQPERLPKYFDIEVPVFKDLTDVEAYREKLFWQVQNVNEFIENEARELEEEKRLDDIEKSKIKEKI